MTDRKSDRAPDDARPEVAAERKPWSRPTLTVRSIEEVTHGAKASVNTDATHTSFDNS